MGRFSKNHDPVSLAAELVEAMMSLPRRLGEESFPQIFDFRLCLRSPLLPRSFDMLDEDDLSTCIDTGNDSTSVEYAVNFSRVVMGLKDI